MLYQTMLDFENFTVSVPFSNCQDPDEIVSLFIAKYKQINFSFQINLLIVRYHKVTTL